MWWRLYFCANRLTIRNDWILNAENFVLTGFIACGRPIDRLQHTHIESNVRCFYLLAIVPLPTLFALLVRSFCVITLRMTSHRNHRTRSAHTLLTLITKLNTTNYSQHDYSNSNSNSNCIFWRLPHTSLMLLAYYLFALLCNLVWILRHTRSLTYSISHSQCGAIYNAHIYHKLYFVTRVLFEY